MAANEQVFKMAMPIIEDVPANLDQFVLMSHQGHFIEADQLYEKYLKHHEAWFDIVVEYAEHLLRLWDPPRLEIFCERVINERSWQYSPDEHHLLSLMTQRARARTIYHSHPIQATPRIGNVGEETIQPSNNAQTEVDVPALRNELNTLLRQHEPTNLDVSFL